MGKSVFILSTIKLCNGKSAGSSRMMNVARALASAGCSVYLCSSKLNVNVDNVHMCEVLPNIFVVGEEYAGKRSVPYRIVNRCFHLFFIARYLFRVLSIVCNIEGEKVFYLYPQPEASMDVGVLFLVHWFESYKVFYDVNELRISSIGTTQLISSTVKREFTRLKYILVENLTRYYDGLVVISTNLEKRFYRYNRTMVRIPILSEPASNGKRFRPSLRNGETFRMCFAGEVSVRKEGMDVLLEALSQLKKTNKNFELHLYGPVTEYDKREIFGKLIPRYGVADNTIYHGVINQTEVPNELRKAHLLLLTRPLNTMTHYGFSTKLAEYMASGVPVLVSNVSDNLLFVNDGVNGYCIDRLDAATISAKLRQIIMNYNTEVERISTGAYDTVERHFNPSRYSSTLYSFLFG